MKVLHIFSILGTAESFFNDQFRYLSENGLDFYLICSPSKKMNDFCVRNKLKGFYEIHILRSISPIKDIQSIFKICQFIKEYEIDVVVGHTPKGALLAMIASFIMMVKHRIYYRHGVVYTTKKGFARFVLINVERFTAALATKIINVSPSLCKLSIVDKVNSDRKQQIIGKGTCGGIDTINVFNPSLIVSDKLNNLRNQYELKQNDLVFGFVGRLCVDKGIIELIDAFKIFQHKHPSIGSKLMLVGAYDTRDKLPDYIKKEIECNSSIINVGRVDHDIQYYYSMIDVFVFPSYREGFGMSVIEASAMEKPILVSKSHGCIDSIVENQTGLYIELSADGIYDGMVKLLDSKTRRLLGINGREFVCSNFERTTLWPLIKNIYQNL